jgi:hypothetical protein
MMRIVLLTLLILSENIVAQGFHRYLDLHVNSNFYLTDLLSIHPTTSEDQLLLLSRQSYPEGLKGRGFSYFSHQSGALNSNFVVNHKLHNVDAQFILSDDLIVQRLASGRFNLAAQWLRIDLEAKDTQWISPLEYSLSDPVIKGDSIFILCSAKAIDYSTFGNEVDSVRTAYLTLLDFRNGTYEFLDSVVYPMPQKFGSLRYLQKQGIWQITQDTLRFTFKNGAIWSESVDSNLLPKAFSTNYSYYFYDIRNTYLRQGFQRTFRDTLGCRLYHVWYREQDTLEYFIDFEGPLLPQEKLNLNHNHPLGSFHARADGVMDWLRYLEGDEIQLHRIEPKGGQHFIQYFEKGAYPHYSISCIRSMPDGSFYLGGGAKRSGARIKALLVKVDSNGLHDPVIGAGIFQIHYNREQDWIDLFMDDQGLELYFEIWTIGGTLIQEGPVKSYEAIQLLKGSKGVHILKLFNRKRDTYYGRRAFVRY